MKRSPIPIARLQLHPFAIWEKRWFLLTSGDFTKGTFNTMTVAWGSLGTMWNLPFAQVVVRPVRHTFGFMERFDTFTLCGFPKQHRQALTLLGTTSGRDVDKIAASGLTPAAATRVAAPCFAEADLVIECRKMYWQDFDPAHFLNPHIEEQYPDKDYHRIYFGEVLALSAASEDVG
jgi:flavin reductase (DIM6/NTAB) family NADH-FMN oxidoreductase RutF